MSFEKGFSGDGLIAKIESIINEAEQRGKKKADQAGKNIGKTLGDGIEDGLNDSKKDVEKTLGEIASDWQSLVRSINKNKTQMSAVKIKVVLDTADALRGTDRFGKEVRRKLSGIKATFGGVEVEGLSNVINKFKEDASTLEKIDWGFGKHHDIMVEQANKQVDAIHDVAVETENATKNIKSQARSLNDVNAELDKEKKKLEDIERQQRANESAREKFKRKRENYGKEVYGDDLAVYDIDLVRGASDALKELNIKAAKRNQLEAEYLKLKKIASKYYTGQFGVGNGTYKDIDDFINQNKDMKRLYDIFDVTGIKNVKASSVATDTIKEYLNNVARSMRSEGSTVGSLLSEGSVHGGKILAKLDEEEVSLNREQQRLLEEREAQLARVNDLRQEELDLIKKAGKEEAKNNSNSKKGKSSSRAKLKEYTGEQWDALTDENSDSYNEAVYHAEEVVQIVRRGNKITADFTTRCKTVKTALDRFYRAIGDAAPEISGTEAEIRESVGNGYFELHDKDTPFGFYVQEIDGGYTIGIRDEIQLRDQLNDKIEETVKTREKEAKSLIDIAINKLHALEQDPYTIKSEAEINKIYEERLAIIKEIGEAKFESYNKDEYERAIYHNQEYENRINGILEGKDSDIYRQLDEQYAYYADRIDSAKELEALLENRLKLMEKIYFSGDDEYHTEEKTNQLIRDRISLMKELEPLVASGTMTKDDLGDIVFERGTLDERREMLHSIKGDISRDAFDESSWEDLLDEAQLFLDRYEKIMVTTASGKKLELGPDMSLADYKAFLNANVEKAKSIEFVRKSVDVSKDAAAAKKIEADAIKNATAATEKEVDIQKKLNEQIMKHVPKSKKNAISDAYKDDDGYWITLKEGWEASNTDSEARVIHSDTIKDLKYQISGIKQLTVAQQEVKKAVEETADARQEEAKATEEAAKEKEKYYKIDEEAARLAKQMRSFDDYKDGSATASYRASVDALAEIVEEKKKQFPDKSEDLDKMLDRYAKNLATFINRDNQIGSQYPSVMISGAGNYNIKKHNKQMASWGKNYQYYDDNVLAIENKIKNFGSSGTVAIRGDEEGALEKLEAKLEYMKYWHQVMVEVNKYYRKNKTIEGFEGAEPDELERIKKALDTMKQIGMHDVPYPAYALSNDSQNIKRIEGRVESLKRLKADGGKSDSLQEENEFYKLWTDKDAMRIRIEFYMDRVDSEIYHMLKKKQFKHTPSLDGNGTRVFQRQLTDNAIYDAKNIQKSLHESFGISDAATIETKAATSGIVDDQDRIKQQIKQIEDDYEAAQNNVSKLREELSKAEEEHEKLIKHSEVYGYTLDMDAKKAGRIQGILAKDNRTQYVVDMLKAGHSPMQTKNGEYGFDRKDLGETVYNPILKTEYEFALYLTKEVDKLNVGWEKGLNILRGINGQLNSAEKNVDDVRGRLVDANDVAEIAYERMSYAHSGIVGDDAIRAHREKKNISNFNRELESRLPYLIGTETGAQFGATDKENALIDEFRKKITGDSKEFNRLLEEFAVELYKLYGVDRNTLFASLETLLEKLQKQYGDEFQNIFGDTVSRFGLNSDNLKKSNAFIGYRELSMLDSRQNYNKSNDADSAMKNIAALFAKYSSEDYGALFGNIPTINAETAVEVYQQLLAKEKEYLESGAKTVAAFKERNKFLEQSVELTEKLKDNEQLMQTRNDLLGRVTDGIHTSDDAMSLLKEAIPDDQAEKVKSLKNEIIDLTDKYAKGFDYKKDKSYFEEQEAGLKRLKEAFKEYVDLTGTTEIAAGSELDASKYSAGRSSSGIRTTEEIFGNLDNMIGEAGLVASRIDDLDSVKQNISTQYPNLKQADINKLGHEYLNGKSVEDVMAKAEEKAKSLLDAEAKLGPVIDENTKKKQEQADAAKKAAEDTEKQLKVEQKLSDEEDDSFDNDSNGDPDNNQNVAEPIIQKQINDAINQIISAQNTDKIKDQFNVDLTNIGSTDKEYSDDLKLRIGEIVEKSLGSGLKVGKIDISDNIASIKLYNKELGVTTQQMWKLEKATEDATEAQLKFVSADKLSVNFEQAGKYAEDQQKKLDDSEKYLLNLQNKLNNQKLSYQHGSKTLSGSNNLLLPDETTLKDDADKTLDSLVEHIQNRINEAKGKILSNAEKNALEKDFIALSNEIKIGQADKYMSGKLSSTEATELRKILTANIETIASRARKANVFGDIEESYNSLMRRLSDDNAPDYLKNEKLSDAVQEIRTLQAETTKAIALGGELKSTLDLQEKLYNAKKKAAEYEAKGDTESSGALAAQRKVKSLEDELELSKKLLVSDEHRNKLSEQEKMLEKELNAFKQEQSNKTTNDADAAKLKEEEQQIKQYYQTILDTVNKINALDVEIAGLKGKNGTGIYSGLINQLQQDKEKLIGSLKGTIKEVAKEFEDETFGIDIGQINNARFFDDQGEDANRLMSFLQKDTVQKALTSGDINGIIDLVDKLNAALNNSKKIGIDAAAGIEAAFQKAFDTASKIFTIDIDAGIIGAQDGINQNSSLYANTQDSYIKLLSKMSELNGKDSADWTAEEASEIEKLTKEYTEYASALLSAKQKEEQYFSNKTKYVDGSGADALVKQSDAAKETSGAYQKLSEAANNFAKESKANGAIITGFAEGADGIAKLDFAILQEGTNTLRKFRIEMGSVTEGMYYAETTANNFMSKMQVAINQLNSSNDLIEKLKSIDGIDMSNNAIVELINAQKKLNDAIADPAVDKSKIPQYTVDVKKCHSEVEKLLNQWMKFQDGIANGSARNLGAITDSGNIYSEMIDKVKVFASKYEDAELKIGSFNTANKTLTFTLTKSDGTVKTFTASLDALGKTVVAQQTGIKNLGSRWDQIRNSISQAGKHFIAAAAGVNVFYRALSMLRTGYTYVKQIDSAMTELKKVTDETDLTYKNFLKDASGTSSIIGSTVSDFAEATANFARLGYEIEESSKMAEAAIVYKNVADGLDSIEESTDSIISTMKAFGIETDGVMGIIDRFNAVGNNFAITSAGIGDAFQRSASALYEGGNTIDESIALVTAANSVIQNPEQVGTALKTLSLRIRGVKTELEDAGLETEGMAETTAQLQAKLKALTGGKVDIMLSPDEFKSTTQILREMAAVWQDMTDVQQAAALELIGGKRQANILSSLISNFKTVEDVIETSLDSQGSAMAENEKYLDSIQGKTDILTNSMQSMWNNAMSSDIIKFLLDVANGFIKITDNIGLLNVAFGSMWAIGTFSKKNQNGEEKNPFSSLFSVFKYDDLNGFRKNADNLFVDIYTKSKQAGGGIAGLSSAFKTLGVSSKLAAIGTNLLNSALSMGISIVAGFLIGKAIEAIDNYIHRVENLKQEVIELSDAYNDAKSTFDNNLITLTTSSDKDVFATLEDEFKVLARGVDEYGNNISLTSDEYSRYKTICEQIIGIQPSIAAGYDSATQAIGNNASVLADLIELQKEEARLKAAEYVSDDNIEKFADNAINDYKAAQQKLQQVKSDSGSNLFDIFAKNSGLISTDEDMNGSSKDDIMRYVLKTMLPNLDPEDINSEINKFYNKDTNGKYDTTSFFQKYREQILQNAYKFGPEISRELQSYVSLSTDALKSAEKEVESAQNSLIDSVYTNSMRASDGYYNLGDSGKKFMAEWIKNSDQFIVDEKTSDDIIKANRDRIMNIIGDLADSTHIVQFDGKSVTAQMLLDQFYNFDPSTVNWEGYKSKMNEFVSAISESTGIDKTGVQAALGINFVVAEQEINDAVKQVDGHLDLTADQIQSNINNMDAKQVKAFYSIDWNEVNWSEVTSWQDVVDLINKQADGTEIVSVKTYSVILESIDSYNEVLKQTEEVVSDNTEVTQEYKDSLKSLGASEEELSECFDENNGLLVKNAAMLRKLVIQKKAERQATIASAKAQAMMQYRSTVMQLQQVVNAMKSEYIAQGFVYNGTLKTIDVLNGQIDALKQTVQQYALLEISLSDAANAYNEFEKARERDTQLSYDDSMIEALQSLNEGFKTGAVGTEEFEYAARIIVPEDILNIEDIDKRMQAIHDYVDKNPLFADWFTIDEDGFSITLDNVNKFVEDAKSAGLFEFDDKGNFFLTDKAESLEAFAKELGVTESVALAMLSALEDYDASWGNVLSDLTTPKLERDIVDATVALDEAIQKQKEFILSGGDLNSEEYAKLKEEVDNATQSLQKAEEAAQSNADKYIALQTIYSAVQGSVKLTQQGLNDLLRTLGITEEASDIGITVNEDGSLSLTTESVDILNGKLGELDEPTTVRVQTEFDETIQELDEVNQQITDLQNYRDGLLENPETNSTLIDFNVDTIDEAKLKIEELIEKRDALTAKKDSISLEYGITTTSSEENGVVEKLMDWETNGMKFTISADTTGLEEGAVVNVTANTEEYDEEKDRVDNETVPDKIITFETKNVQPAIDDINRVVLAQDNVDTDVTIKYTTELNDPYGVFGSGGESGASSASGSANASGNVGLQSGEHNSLVGEMGPELVVDPNKGIYYTVGDNGTEMVDLPKGAIIYNHKQTKDILLNGRTASRGKFTGGYSFASGNSHYKTFGAYVGPNDVFKNGSDTWMDPWTNIADDTSDSIKDAAGDISDAADEFKEVFDWIEVRIEEIEETLGLLNAQLENAIGSSKQNAIIDDMIDVNKKLYDNLIAGANEYYSYAKSLLSKVPEAYRAAAQDGTIAIETFVGEVDEKTLEAIQDYREWVQKGADATQQAEEVLTEIQSLAKQAFDNIANEFENNLSLNDSKIDRFESHNGLLETDKGFESENIYQAIIDENKSKIKLLEQQSADLQAELDSGKIEKYSDDWYDAVNTIAEVDTEIINLKTEIEDLQDSINELHWEKFDVLMKKFEAINSEAENLIDILGQSDAVDEFGNWTDKGMASLGLLAQQMETAEMQAKQYQEEIDYLNKNWKKLGYTEEEYIDRLDELKSGQYDSIKAYHEAKDAVVDLNKERIDAIKEGIEKEIEAYEELINKKKEALDADKDAHDWQKNVAEQQKNISDIERQIAALSADDSASARAKRAQLEADLIEAKAEMDEMYYDRSVEKQKEALDEELESFQDEKNKEIEGWEKYLENVELVVSDTLAMVQENTKTVLETLTTLGQEFGLTITEALTNPWKAGETAIQDYGVVLNMSLTQLAALLGLTVDEFASKLDLTTEGLVSKLGITVSEMATSLGLTNEQLAAKLGITTSQLSGKMNLTIQDFATQMGLTIPQLASKLGTTTAGLVGNLDMTMTQFAGRLGLTVDQLSGKFGLTTKSLASKLGQTYQQLTNPFGMSMSATVDELKKLEKEYQKILTEITNESIKTVSQVNHAMSKYQTATSKPAANTSTSASTSKNSTSKTATIGSRINAGTARIYSDSYGGGGGKQYYANDPIYTIVGENNGYWLVRYHKLSSGYTGWFKKSDVKAYAKGTTSIPKDQWALIDELGEELQLIPDGNGRLSYMKKGTGVVPADLTANLMEWGKLDPVAMLDQNRPQIGASPSVVNNTTEIHIDASVGELMHVEHLDGNNPAEVTKLIDKAWDKRMKELNSFVRKYSR